MLSGVIVRMALCALLMLGCNVAARAQIVPAEHHVLTGRIVGCAIPVVKGAKEYTLQVARGRYNDDDIFVRNIIRTQKGDKNRFIADLPDFGAQYTWRISAGSVKGALHHFSIATAADIDPDSFRLRVQVARPAQDSQYVFIDGARVLYDLAGNPVWFLPQPDSISRSQDVRDIKMSSWATITFLVNGQACEMAYDGTMLWREPQAVFQKSMSIDDRLKYFHHHTLTHLASDKYITLGMERSAWELPAKVTKNKGRMHARIIVNRKGVARQQIFTNKVVVFDTGHKVVWSWSFADYLKASDIHDRHRRNGMFIVGGNAENDCYLDENAKSLYVSMNTINRIVKVRYPDGKLLNTYGPRYIAGNLELANDLFCGQHSPRRSKEGYLYLFNNNVCNRLCNGWPSILMLQEPAKPGQQLKKVWEFECLPDSMSAEDEAKLKFTAGGNAQELPNRSLFACMGGNYSKVFIVSRDKKILWSALPEKWNPATATWQPRSGYHASIITRKELESLIWNEPLKK